MASTTKNPDELPSATLLSKIASYPVLDRDGKEYKFQDLYAGPDATERTLIVFVRHFFCGVCFPFLPSGFYSRIPTGRIDRYAHAHALDNNLP
jgi:hypothetical protein